MNAQFDCGHDRDEVFIGAFHPMDTENRVFPSGDVGWTPLGDQVKVKQNLNPCEKNINVQRDKTSGTDLVRRIHAMPHQNIGKDVFIDNEVGTAIHDAIAWLDGHYNFRKPDEVKSFLSGNNTLIKMLSSIYSKIRKEFPSERIILEVFPDSPHSSEKDIVVSVATTLSVDEAIERLDKVEDVRWNKDSNDPYINICVKLQYQ